MKSENKAEAVLFGVFIASTFWLFLWLYAADMRNDRDLEYARTHVCQVIEGER